MKLGYVLLYVEDVEATAHFYEEAFGIEVSFLHESKTYAELETGATRLGIVSRTLASETVDFQMVTPKTSAPGIEIAFVTDDVPAAFQRAVRVGAEPMCAPIQKAWGQTVSYVRDRNGFLIEICSPMGG